MIAGTRGGAPAAGADAAVDYADPDLASRILAAAPEGVDVYWDTSGRGDLAAAVTAMAPGGRILLTAGCNQRLALPAWDLYTRDASLRGFVISRATAAGLASAARLVNRMLAEGRLSARIAAQLPLADPAQAHRRIEEGGVPGRLVLCPPHERPPALTPVSARVHAACLRKRARGRQASGTLSRRIAAFERFHGDLRANEAWLTVHSNRRRTLDGRHSPCCKLVDIVARGWHVRRPTVRKAQACAESSRSSATIGLPIVYHGPTMMVSF